MTPLPFVQRIGRYHYFRRASRPLRAAATGDLMTASIARTLIEFVPKMGRPAL